MKYTLQDYQENFGEGMHLEFPVLGDKNLPERLVTLAQEGKLSLVPQHSCPWGLILDVSGTEEDVCVNLSLDQAKLNSFLKENFKRLSQFTWADYGVHVAGPAGVTGFTQVYLISGVGEDGIALAGVETTDTGLVSLGEIHITEEGFHLITAEVEEAVVEEKEAEAETSA